MKLLFCLLLMVSTSVAFGQQTGNQSTAKYFGQCLFSITDNAELEALQTEMRENDNLEMVRLDHNTQRALIITHGLSGLTEEEFTSWFGTYGVSVHCVQIGVYGVDSMNPYPFTNCQN